MATTTRRGKIATRSAEVAAAPDRPDLDALLAFWAPIVRVADWEIHIAWKRHMDSGGLMSCNIDTKQAWVDILDPIDWLPHQLKHMDAELFVVHELLHIHFAPFNTVNDTPLGIAEEQTVHSLATALVKVRRMTAKQASI